MRKIATRALLLALIIVLGPASVRATVLTYNSGTTAHFTSESSLLLLIGTGLIGLGVLLRRGMQSV